MTKCDLSNLTRCFCCFRLTVTLKRDQQLPFKGFFVQARRVRDLSLPPVGRFITRQHAVVRCGSTPAVSTPCDGVMGQCGR